MSLLKKLKLLLIYKQISKNLRNIHITSFSKLQKLKVYLKSEKRTQGL